MEAYIKDNPIHVDWHTQNDTAGLPVHCISPNDIHYWVIFERFVVTIIYNTPSLFDKSAAFYNIIVDE